MSNNFNFSEIENKWIKKWEEENIYKFDQEQAKLDPKNVLSIDSPPPTVSGSLHLGHVFSYTQTDLIARFNRMCGKNIFYPMGWDDNGLPTERRVQNYYGIKCKANLGYDKKFTPTKSTSDDTKSYQEISRKNFIETCEILTKEDEKAFEQLWKTLGLSIEWKHTYATIDKHCQKTSQLSFLKLLAKKRCYQKIAPTMWDVDFKSAIAQAEIEDREQNCTYHYIKFQVLDNAKFSSITIATTRPELLGACICVVAHPEDERFKDLFGSFAVTPLYGAKVPILPAIHADPKKGTGILMVCTFGDINDVNYWKQQNLPLKNLIGLDGEILPINDFSIGNFASLNPCLAKKCHDQLASFYTKKARNIIAKILEENLAIDTSPPVFNKQEKPDSTHQVKFYEKGDRPLEIIPTRQWFIDILNFKEQFLELGEKINWVPNFMKTRYDHWVNGLNQDWCISRQRFFGIPFPVWYKIDLDGKILYEDPILALTTSLPIDPSTDIPEGFTESQRDQKGGFTADPDVMDTWATSSLTPQIVSNWANLQECNKEENNQNILPMPMTIRPQAHEIIRTWAFYTIVQSFFHSEDKGIPWENILISGWVLDPDRKKMSKSKGNVVTPQDLFDKYSSDAIRYWASKGRLGCDTAIDEQTFKIGQKLTTKLFNASKFVLSLLEQHKVETPLSCITNSLDLAMITKVAKDLAQATNCFKQFDYTGALTLIEENFWYFCDHYIELVKTRSYQQGSTTEDGRSSLATLKYLNSVFLRSLAPYLPFTTEEVWSWFHNDINTNNKSFSVHKSCWPDIEKELGKNNQKFSINDNYSMLESIITILSSIRGKKTVAQKNQRSAVALVTVHTSDINLEKNIQPFIQDLINAGNITGIFRFISSENSLKTNLEIEKKLNSHTITDVEVILEQQDC